MTNKEKVYRIIAISLCLFICSCKTTKVVTVERVTHDTTFVAREHRDSIYLHDSVFVKEWQKGDTVFITTMQWKDRWRERIVKDTLRVVKVDSIPVPYPVVKEVEKKLTKAQKGLMWTGGLSIMALLAFVYRKIRR